MPNYEVPEPILNSPYKEPALHWYIDEGAEPEKRTGRREGNGAAGADASKPEADHR
jgi:type III restriction enzyme